MEEEAKEKVKEMLNTIRPQLQAHGGDIELVAIEEDGTVKVRLQGACAGCPGAAMTLRDGVERALREVVPTIKAVVAV